MKQFLFLVGVLFLVPAAVQASAMKECRVEAVVKKIKEAGKTPVLLIEVKSAVFERGHSMGNDCTGLTNFPDQEVKLREPFATKVGAKIVLLYVEVVNDSPVEMLTHRNWEVHPDELKKTPAQGK